VKIVVATLFENAVGCSLARLCCGGDDRIYARLCKTPRGAESLEYFSHVMHFDFSILKSILLTYLPSYPYTQTATYS
jgi:hypothetical protein